jgi:hypothetical protein
LSCFFDYPICLVMHNVLPLFDDEIVIVLKV